jgi:glycosyltransferase involved in cell wall biosynthesis
MEKTVRDKQLKSVAGHGSESEFVIREEGIGWFVEAGKPKVLVDAILEAQSNPEKLLTMEAKARSVAEQKYSRKKVVNEYCKLIDSIL